MRVIRCDIRNQDGFTLIEIVMVIVLLGVLAAIAIPKYIDLKKDAQNATADGIVASISSSAAIGYAKSAITGTATYPTITQLDQTYLNVKNVEYWTYGAQAFTGDIKGVVYFFTYLQSDGSATRSSP